MNRDEKKVIAAQLKAYCDRMGSQNKAANSLEGVSSATISKMLTGEWESINDKMWRGISAQLGITVDEWKMARTQVFDRMSFLLSSAQSDSLVVAATGDAGCGKTAAITHYAGTRENVFHLVCSEFWNRRVFMQKLLKQMGVNSGGLTVSDMMDEAISALKRMETPLVVLDEADKLTDQVLYFFISLYNQLEDHCGIMLVATNYLEKRISKGLRTRRKGYQEIFSRMGRKFIAMNIINDEDIANVCIANGVTNAKTIRKIAADSDNDLRRVKRAVWAELKQRGNEGDKQ